MAPEDSTPEVLTSLPRTRPQRRSAKRDTAAKPRAKKAAMKTPAPRKAAAKTPAKAAPKTRAKATPGPRAAEPSRRIPPAGFAPPADASTRPAPGAAELVGTAIQAAGELVQIGAAIGGQALRSALGRLGRD